MQMSSTVFYHFYPFPVDYKRSQIAQYPLLLDKYKNIKSILVLIYMEYWSQFSIAFCKKSRCAAHLKDSSVTDPLECVWVWPE